MRLMIDTRKAVKELKAVGFSEDQADLVASLFSSTIPWEELVTKEYLSKELDLVEQRLDNKLEVIRSEINELKASLRGEMNGLRMELGGEIQKQSASQIKWIVSMQAVILGIALTISRLL